MSRLKLSFIVILLLAKKDSFGEEQKIQNDNGFGYELIQFKLECLETRISELSDQLKKQVELGQQQFSDNLERKVTQLEKGIESSLGNKVSQITDKIVSLQTTSSKYDPLKNRLFDLVNCTQQPKTSGLCLVDMADNKTVVYQVNRFGYDWLIVLQRSDGSENFHRNWTDYRDGFGTAGQEFWLGLERLHVLTKKDSYELLVELEDFSGNYKYARYDNFSIGAEQDLYRLNGLGIYSGTAGDSLLYHKGRQFSTLDKEQNITCSRDWTGGWWYGNCYNSHLTGKWQRIHEWTSIAWIKFGPVSKTPVKFARMMIRKIYSENVA